MKDHAAEVNLESILELQDLDIEIMLESEGGEQASSARLTMQEEISRIFGRLFLLRKKRRSLAQAVSNELLGQYEQLRNKKGLILAVVPVENGICQACMKPVPKPNLFLMMKKEPISTCPACGRFVYLSE